LSLEASDNDAVALWWSMIAALRTVSGTFGEAYRTRLLGGSGAVDEVVVSVCNELAERDTPIHLFLDDLAVVDSEMSRRSLHTFVLALPDGVRVTAASRSAAPIPLGRLRANSDLVEIDHSDLALSKQEANQLLSSLDPSLDRAHRDLLVARTEGWPAGLQLAGLAIAKADDAGSFAADFSGADRDVAEYLVSEVLESISREERDFMIDTSILSRLSGDLCDAVTGRSGGAEILAHLERSNAFVIPLDRTNGWYRYHHLFGELLAAELLRTRPNEERLLHQRAFEWLRDAGEVAEAIRHGIAAGESDAAADLLCGSWRLMMGSGRAETARALVLSFGRENLANHQPFAIAAAGVLAMTGHPEAAQRWLDAAETATYDGPRADGMASSASAVALMRGSIARDGVDAALADGRAAFELEPPDSPHRTLAALIVGRSLALRGDIDDSTEFLEKVAQDDYPNTRAYALAELSLAQLGRGDAEEALAAANAARMLMHETGGDDLFVAATAQGAIALAAIALGDERAARVALREAHRPMVAVSTAMPIDATHTRLILARAALALGEAEIARGYLRDAQAVIDSISDVGDMREEHTQLMVQLDALQPGADGVADEEFTNRELEVVALLPSPLTTREIGEELFVSRNTIKTHLRRVYRKLNASSREEAVLISRDRGLLPGSDDRQPSPG
jgi:LuxR family maltose regulon positive regulatory protein